MSQRQKLGKMTGSSALHMHTTNLPDIDSEWPSTPLNFYLPVETRTRHTRQAMIRVQEGVDSFGQLRASPSAVNSAMGRLSTAQGIAFAGTRRRMRGSGKGAGTLGIGIAREKGCRCRRQRQGGTGAGGSRDGGRDRGGMGRQGEEGGPGEEEGQGRGTGEQRQATIAEGGGGGQPKAEPTPHRLVCVTEGRTRPKGHRGREVRVGANRASSEMRETRASRSGTSTCTKKGSNWERSWGRGGTRRPGWRRGIVVRRLGSHVRLITSNSRENVGPGWVYPPEGWGGEREDGEGLSKRGAGTGAGSGGERGEWAEEGREVEMGREKEEGAGTGRQGTVGERL